MAPAARPRTKHTATFQQHQLPTCSAERNKKADSTLRSSRAVPHPSTNRALRRLTSEVGRDPVHSTRYGRRRKLLCSHVALFAWSYRRSYPDEIACALCTQHHNVLNTPSRLPSGTAWAGCSEVLRTPLVNFSRGPTRKPTGTTGRDDRYDRSHQPVCDRQCSESFDPMRARLQSARTHQVCCWAEARIKIARMTLTINLDRNWSSFQLANSAPPLSVTDSAIAPSARMLSVGYRGCSYGLLNNMDDCRRCIEK